MSHLSRGMAAARMKDRKHAGHAARIRALLAERTEPVSPSMMATLTGLKIEQVRRALTTMLSQTGGVVSLRRPGRQEITYILYRAVRMRRSAGSGRIAERIEIGRGSRWWASLV